MSTRSQIEFRITSSYEDKKGKRKTVVERRTVYQHSDGYPSWIIPDLREFLAWNDGRNCDVEYTAANFIYWGKKKLEQYLEDDFHKQNYPGGWKDKSGNNIVKIGFGVCENDELHGDIRYFYRVHLAKSNEDVTTIECFEPSGQFSDDGTKLPKEPFATVVLNSKYKVRAVKGLNEKFDPA